MKNRLSKEKYQRYLKWVAFCEIFVKKIKKKKANKNMNYFFDSMVNK